MRRGQAIVVSDWTSFSFRQPSKEPRCPSFDKSDLHRPRKKRENACKVVSET
jgi:hypothetical protein